MSTDDLLRILEQSARTISSLRQHAPLFAAMATLETPSRCDLHDAILHLLRQSEFPGAFAELPTITYSGSAPPQSHAVFTRPSVTQAETNAAFRAYQVVAERIGSTLWSMSDDASSRLGFQRHLGAMSWLSALFHLAWHFPSHFAGGAVYRFRLLRADSKNLTADFRAPEDWLQLHTCNLTEDRYEGLIFSQFPWQLDLVTATEWAIELLRNAVQRSGRLQSKPDYQCQFRELHRVFTSIGDQVSNIPQGTPFTEFDVKLLRLDSSFETQPASVWAGGFEAGARRETFFLSRKNAVKECCVLRGAWVTQFVEYADRAGALLPEWPATPYPALFHDVQMWQTRVRKRQELAQEQFHFVTPDGSPPNGEPIPRDQFAKHYWESTRTSSCSSGLVTDQRGNVERWLGYVFAILKEYEPEAIEIRAFPEGEIAVGPVTNAVLILTRMNLFHASARAIELAGVLSVSMTRATTPPVPVDSGQPLAQCPTPPCVAEAGGGTPDEIQGAKLTPTELLAWTQYCEAKTKLFETEGVDEPTDAQAFEWLTSEEQIDPNRTMDAWKKALERARKKLKKGKYTKRPKYTGRSAVRKDELNDARKSE